MQLYHDVCVLWLKVFEEASCETFQDDCQDLNFVLPCLQGKVLSEEKVIAVWSSDSVISSPYSRLDDTLVEGGDSCFSEALLTGDLLSTLEVPIENTYITMEGLVK